MSSKFSRPEFFQESPDTFFDRQLKMLATTEQKRRSEPFWRIDEPIIDEERKILVGGMWDYQRKIWLSKNFLKVLLGGYGSGKSNLGCKRIIALALENAPVPVATVSPTFSMARRTVIPQISEFLQAKQNQYGSAFDWKYNSGVHEFKIRFEGRQALIQVLSGENPKLLKGANLGAVFMDEPFIQDQEVFIQMNARIRHPDATKKEFLLCGTPEMSDWGYDLCSGNLKGFSDVCVVRASTRGNKALGPEFVARLEGMYSEKAAKVYLDGHFLNLSEGMVYYAFDPEDHVVELTMPKGAQLGCGMDFNVNPMAMSVFWTYDGHIHFIDEFELPNADTEYACQVLHEKYGRMGLKDVYPDASGRLRSTKAPGGRSDFHFIREAGFTVNSRDANPARKDRYNAVNGKFKSKSGKISLTISPKCKSIIKYLSTYSHELLNKQEHLSHLLDSMTYPISYLFPVDRTSIQVQKIQGI